MADNATRVCLGCAEHLPMSAFPLNGKGKRRPRCSRCRNTDQRAHYQAHHDQMRLAAYKRAYHLGERFGLTVADYDRMLAAQGGRCAICRANEPGGRAGRFHVDHDRSCCSGRDSCGRCVRGLLCHSCNTGLGKFRDDPAALLAAVAYLEGGGPHR